MNKKLFKLCKMIHIINLTKREEIQEYQIMHPEYKGARLYLTCHRRWSKRWYEYHLFFNPIPTNFRVLYICKILFFKRSFRTIEFIKGYFGGTDQPITHDQFNNMLKKYNENNLEAFLQKFITDAIL